MNYVTILLVFCSLTILSCNSPKEADTTDLSIESPKKQGQSINHSAKALKKMSSKFKTMDANNDGKLVKSEVNERFASYFDEVDLDGDGFVTMEEIKKSPLSNKANRKKR